MAGIPARALNTMLAVLTAVTVVDGDAHRRRAARRRAHGAAGRDQPPARALVPRHAARRGRRGRGVGACSGCSRPGSGRSPPAAPSCSSRRRCSRSRRSSAGPRRAGAPGRLPPRRPALTRSPGVRPDMRSPRQARVASSLRPCRRSSRASSRARSPASSCGATRSAWRSSRSTRCTPATRWWCPAPRSTTGSTSIPTLAAHLFQVAQTIGQAQMAALVARRIGVMIVGDEVPHVHLHVVPFDSVSELSFAHADPNPPEGSLEAAAAKIRAALRDLGARRRRRSSRMGRHDEWVARDAAVVWHGFTQMDAYADNAPIIVERARGPRADRRRRPSLPRRHLVAVGQHARPPRARARRRRPRSSSTAARTPPCSATATVVVVELAEALARVVPVDDPHFLFASDGAAAVEQALKIAFQYWANRGVAGHTHVPRVRRRVPRRHHRRALGRRRRLRHRPLRPAALPRAAGARLRRPRVLRHRDARWSRRTRRSSRR